MVDKVFIFGDSFMYGEESHQHTIDQNIFLQKASEAIGRKFELNKDGIPTQPFSSIENTKYISFINQLYKDINVHPNDNSIGVLLAKELNVPYVMKALSGNSNNTIFKTFIDCLPDMTKDSLVVFGISQPNRKSYYEGEWVERHPAKHVTSCWSDVTDQSGWDKFEKLDLIFGDDATAQVLQTYSIVKTVQSLCPCKILFIDPFHQFCDNKYHPDIPKNFVKKWSDDWEKYNHKSLLNFLEKEFKSLFTYGISEVFEEVTNDGHHIQCVNGHYSLYTYKKYVERVLLDAIQ